MFRSLDQFIHQNIDQRFLEACTDIGLVLLHKVRIQGHLVTNEVQQRSLYAAETIVKTRDLRL